MKKEEEVHFAFRNEEREGRRFSCRLLGMNVGFRGLSEEESKPVQSVLGLVIFYDWVLRTLLLFILSVLKVARQTNLCASGFEIKEY